MTGDQIEGKWKRFTGSAASTGASAPTLTGKLPPARRTSWSGDATPPSASRALPQKEYMDRKKQGLARVAYLWCKWMHDEPMWPSHGQYECRKCGRLHPVSWQQPLPVPTHTPVLPCETLGEAVVAATESRIQC